MRAYKRLSAVERAFRSLKTVDLKVRPVFHHAANRVRAHVLLCMLAYYVEWHLRERLKPLLFDDDDPAAGEAARASIVAPAQVSEAAKEKSPAQNAPRTDIRCTASAPCSATWRRSPGTGSSRACPAPNRSRSSPGPPRYSAKPSNCSACGSNVSQ